MASTGRTAVPEVALCSGSARPMPAVAMGTASATPVPHEATRDAVLAAIEVGFRHLDTACMYGTERPVGEAVDEVVRRGLVQSQEEVFVTSKLWCTMCHPDLVLPSLRETLDLGKAVALLLGVSSPVIIVAGYHAYRTGRLGRGLRRLRVWALGGVTTLEEALGYSCALCGGSLDAREEVRTLSCDHVFHRCESDKCKNVIDDWLRENRVACPVCRKVALPVPWKAPPTSASNLEDPLLRQAPSPSSSSSGSQEPPLPLSTMASGEEPTLSSPASEESR